MDIQIIKEKIKKYKEGHAGFINKAGEAERYYRNETDILFNRSTKEKEEIGETPLRNADNRIPFNFHGLLVNQKASYMFTAPPMFDIGSKAGNKKLQAFLGDKYHKTCKDLCIEASNATVGWIHIWKDRVKGFYRYAVVPSMQIIPMWNKSLEKELVGVLRYYRDMTEEGKEIEVYEYWNDLVCQAYCVKAGDSIETGLAEYPRFLLMDEYGVEKESSCFEHGIGEVPFFAFYNNNTGTNDLKNIKPLIDTYCKVFSGFVNDLEDIQEVIFILTNYGGADLGEFLSDLKYYKAIKIDADEDDSKSGVSTLSIELPVEARKELLATTRKCIFEQGQGIDPDPQNFGNSSGVALSFLYSLLELKSGLMEVEFRPSFGRFIRCICRLLNLEIKDDVVVQTWTRTSVRNDTELASIAQQSNGIVSNETILKNHPWVENAEQEKQQIKKEAGEESGTYQDAFQKKEGGEHVNAKEQ